MEEVIQPPTGTVTLMFTDIVGSTALRDALVAALGETAGDRQYRERVRDPHDARIRGLLEKNHGFEVKTIGDSFMVAFGRPEDAVVCAAEIQRGLRDQPIKVDDAGTPLAVRIGMHTGAAELVERDGRPDYDGHAVNIAARVEGLLKGGERVYCSAATAMLAGKTPALRFHSYGVYTPKGLTAGVEIFDVLWDDAMQPAPPEQPHEGLPYPWLTPWIGRERQMEELTEALLASRLVTLHGTGGVGKTRLAVETLLARSGGLPREIVFIPLERVADSPAGLLGAVRDALGLTEVDAPDVETLCKQLRGGDRLLLLDNFESVAAASPWVPRLAATPGVRVLLTSQRVLGVDGERVVDLDPMPTKGDLPALESYRLFAGLAQQRDARWQPDDEASMRDVLAATDGLPYLIELVAAVAPKRLLRQLAGELENHLSEVRARGNDVLRPERHVSVQACLEWATGRLPAEERQALPRLAVFHGGFEAEAAEAIAETTLGSLDILIDASLLRFDRQTGRYSMLPTTQHFAWERLDPNDQRPLASRHAGWFVDHLDKADDALRAKGAEAQRAARRWIDAEWENLQQAVALAEEEEPDLFRLAVPAFGIYLRWTCRFSEDVRLNEVLLARTDREAAPKDWAMMNNNLGLAYGRLPTGDRGENLKKAIACHEAALQVRTERDSPKNWATTQNNLGNAYVALPTGDRGENLEKALACYEAALRVWTEREFPAEWAATQTNLGTAYMDLPKGDRGENLRMTIACYEAALRVRTERDFPADWALTQCNLGIAYARLPAGDRDANLRMAIARYEAALRVYTERDFPAGWAATQSNLGAAYANLPTGDRGDNLRRAVACYEAALRVWTERDFPADWAMAQNNLANAYKDLPRGDRGENLRIAIACYEAASRGYAAVGLLEEAERVRQRAAKLKSAT